MDNHAQRMRQALERQMACLRKADPNLQANIMTQQESDLMHLMVAICNECMLQAKFNRRGNFQMLCDGCFARKKVEHECLIANKRKNPVHASPQQQVVARSRGDDSQHLSKALANGRGVQQAIKHVAATLGTSGKKNTALR
jgi:hypothetical protein